MRKRTALKAHIKYRWIRLAELKFKRDCLKLNSTNNPTEYFFKVK